jgi:hypothetical protein
VAICDREFRRRARELVQRDADLARGRTDRGHAALLLSDLDIPAGLSGAILRYHPTRPLGQNTQPCMIALVRGIANNEFHSIRRTALHLDGSPVKIDGKTHTRVARLKPGTARSSSRQDEEVTHRPVRRRGD